MCQQASKATSLRLVMMSMMRACVEPRLWLEAQHGQRFVRYCYLAPPLALGELDAKFAGSTPSPESG